MFVLKIKFPKFAKLYNVRIGNEYTIQSTLHATFIRTIAINEFREDCGVALAPCIVIGNWTLLMRHLDGHYNYNRTYGSK